jgi:hypothetical protein
MTQPTMTEDFDYIGTGGFLIECQGGETVGVTKEQAEVVEQNCVFLQNCFRHGTLEAQNSKIRKPDWSLAIARHLIEALTKGSTTLPNLQLYQELMEAGDQALLDLRLCSLVNYIDPTPSRDHRFLDLVDPSKYRFLFKGNILSEQWLQLLDKGILLYRKETNFVVQLYKEQVLDREQMVARRKLDTRVSEYLVHADQTIHAVSEIQKIMNGGQPSRRDLSERFSIYFETTESIPKDHHELIDRLAGGEAYIRTCADASECRTEGYTVRASFDVLSRSIRPLSQRDDIHCSLRVDNPTPDTLGRFINACRAAKDFPSTLGLDASTNRYFCRKTIRDIHAILEYMADFSTESRIKGEFNLYELSSEDKPF